MITVSEALRHISQHSLTLAPERRATLDSLGLRLAVDAASDIDSPPHDKSMVDGYALLVGDVQPSATLTVLEQVTAGETPSKLVVPGSATRIMTGAPIPDGADAVVMVEQTESLDDGSRVRLQSDAARKGQNIMRRATSIHANQVILKKGAAIRGIEMGLLSETGHAEVQVFPRPRVAVLATGDELVAADRRPAPGQIRNSNGPMLMGLIRQAGGEPIDLGVARDDEPSLREAIERGLEADVLVLSGGVSAGVLDLVPKVLSECGVRTVFHKVSVRPGKPLWFGLREAPSRSLVFGLPGNPVSSLVCFELFARPSLARLAGGEGGLVRGTATLVTAHRAHGDRPTYFPARQERVGKQATVALVQWQGSADLCSLADANCLAYFEAGDRSYAAGESIDVFQL